MRDGLLTVAEVARKTGVTRKALRLYERLGLVEPAARTPASYRLYDEQALRRIDWVLRAKLLGLSLTEARELLHMAEGCCGANHPELAGAVRRKLAETEQRIRELQGLRDTLGCSASTFGFGCTAPGAPRTSAARFPPSKAFARPSPITNAAWWRSST